MASLLYGAGLRLQECLMLRVKDVDFAYRQIVVRDGKGGKDRVTVLPENVVQPLQAHLGKVRSLHRCDLEDGYGEVWLPHALQEVYPRAGYEWGWQFVFPSKNRSPGVSVRSAGADGGLVVVCPVILVSSVMLPEDFHPVLQRWWETRFREPGSGRILPPTEAQLEGWRAIRSGQHTLIAAPTGSGKTLAAFLTSIDQLLRESLAHFRQGGELPDEVRVVYVSPLKALSADIHKNLAEPRREMRRIAEE